MGIDIYLNKKEIEALLDTIHFHNVLVQTIIKKTNKMQDKNTVLLSLREKINRNSRSKEVRDGNKDD